MLRYAVESGRAAPGPESVAESVLRALTAKRPPLRIPVVTSSILGNMLPRLLPARMIDWLIAWRLGFLEARRAMQSKEAF
jgi:hypothetical protein